jgi:hypothetical protein
VSALNLVIDRQNRKLVQYNGSIVSIPPIFQGNVVDVKVTVVDPTGALGGGAAYTKVNLGSYGLRVSIGATPTGTSGGPTPLALQNVFTWDSVDSSFSGSLEVNTAAVNSHIGTAAQATAYFEVNLTLNGERITVLQEQFTLKAVVDEATTTAPTPTDSYMTTAESVATFAKFVNTPGAVIVLVSPDGTKGVELGCGDDGAFFANEITL